MGWYRIERGSPWWKFYVAAIYSFWHILAQSWKIAGFATYDLTYDPQKWGQILT